MELAILFVTSACAGIAGKAAVLHIIPRVDEMIVWHALRRLALVVCCCMPLLPGGDHARESVANNIRTTAQ